MKKVATNKERVKLWFDGIVEHFKGNMSGFLSELDVLLTVCETSNHSKFVQLMEHCANV